MLFVLFFDAEGDVEDFVDWVRVEDAEVDLDVPFRIRSFFSVSTSVGVKDSAYDIVRAFLRSGDGGIAAPP